MIYSRSKRLKRVRTKRSGSIKLVLKTKKEGEASFGGDFDLMIWSAVLSAFLSPFLLFLSHFSFSLSRARVVVVVVVVAFESASFDGSYHKERENKNSLAAARVSSACSPFCWLQMNLDLL